MDASVFIATSLDGYIARPDGDIDWLDQVPAPEGEDYGFQAFMDTVDALVMGRHTFELLLSLDGPWYYGETPVIVLSSRAVEIPEERAATVEHMAGAPGEIAARLAERGVAATKFSSHQQMRFRAPGIAGDLAGYSRATPLVRPKDKLRRQLPRPSSSATPVSGRASERRSLARCRQGYFDFDRHGSPAFPARRRRTIRLLSPGRGLRGCPELADA